MVGDFGISKCLSHTLEFAVTSTGTPLYLSPEICQGLKYDSKTDMWNLGIVLFEMLTLDRPFQGATIPEVIKAILANSRPPLPSDTDPLLASLVDRLLVTNPNKRASAQDLLEIPEILAQAQILLPQKPKRPLILDHGFSDEEEEPRKPEEEEKTQSRPMPGSAKSKEEEPSPYVVSPVDQKQKTPIALVRLPPSGPVKIPPRL
jgi:NIMA (never in mitosis gene a)-related kinase